YVINDLTIHDGYIFIATNGGVYYSSDTAKNWIQVNENLSNLLISQITVLDGHLFVTTLGDGIWKRQIWETTDLNKISRVQYKVYPNPTNGFFSLETSDNIKQISVYDVMGNELQVIKNQFEDSITKMDLTHLAPGIYFIKLQTDKGSAIEKIIIQ
ncbi:MAG TPA: T9SS type A sorting domain-containing protein, partial [Bacteroidia bacterium]